MHKRGFTLIELLVVIAIIGILSSIVIASLNSARSKANDAAVKANLGNIRSQAALYYDSNSQSYGTTGNTCSQANSVFADANVTAQIAQATQNASGAPTCANSSAAWVVSAPLKGGGSWCVDSTGRAASSTADAANYVCQ